MAKFFVKIGVVILVFAMETNRSMMRDRDFSIFWYFISQLLVDDLKLIQCTYRVVISSQK